MTDTQPARDAARRSNNLGIELPTVSIVITNFNYIEYVRDALESALDQTYPQIEILFVDDLSTDGSWELVRDLVATDPRFAAVKMHRLDVSSGQTGAAFAGFEASSGSYVIFLDADDVIMPRCVETHVYAHLSSRLAVGFSSVDCLILIERQVLAGRGSYEPAAFMASGRGRLSGMVRPIEKASDGLWLNGSAPPIAPEDIHFVLPPQCDPWVWSYMSGHCFRRDALKLFLRGPLEGLKTGTDGFLVKPISAMCGSMVIDKILMGYRVHGSNAFTTSAPLLRLQSYGPTQIERMLEVNRRSVTQMLDQADAFALNCETPSCFFQAIERLCLSWPLHSEHGDVHFLQKMQKTYETGLVRAFGRATFDDWVRASAAATESPRSSFSGAPPFLKLWKREST